VLGFISSRSEEPGGGHLLSTEADRSIAPVQIIQRLLVLSILLVSACTKGSQSGETSGAEQVAQTEAYKSQLELSHVGLAKGENYLGNEVFYVEGVVKNNGSRAIQRVELLFLFKDSLNQVVLREARKAVDYKGGKGLEPQKSTNFQVAFERLPKDWNYVVPDVQVSNLNFK
jgi:hypothetical protein